MTKRQNDKKIKSQKDKIIKSQKGERPKNSLVFLCQGILALL